MLNHNQINNGNSSMNTKEIEVQPSNVSQVTMTSLDKQFKIEILLEIKRSLSTNPPHTIP